MGNQPLEPFGCPVGLPGFVQKQGLWGGAFLRKHGVHQSYNLHTIVTLSLLAFVLDTVFAFEIKGPTKTGAAFVPAKSNGCPFEYQAPSTEVGFFVKQDAKDCVFSCPYRRSGSGLLHPG